MRARKREREGVFNFLIDLLLRLVLVRIRAVVLVAVDKRERVSLERVQDSARDAGHSHLTKLNQGRTPNLS